MTSQNLRLVFLDLSSPPPLVTTLYDFGMQKKVFRYKILTPPPPLKMQLSICTNPKALSIKYMQR